VGVKGQLIMSLELSEKVLWSLLDGFRLIGASEDVAFIASLQVLAWAKLSKCESLPTYLVSSEDNLPSDIGELNQIFFQLSELESIGENRNAFREFLTIHNDVKISQIMSVVLQLERQKLLGKFNIHSHLLENSSKYRQNFDSIIPIEIVYLMIGLAGDIKGKNVYCPWDNLSEFASNIDTTAATVSIETDQNSVFPWLVNIFKETNFKISITNPVQNPGFLSGKELKRFDVSIALPPLGKKYDIGVCSGDCYRRFPEKTGSGAVLNIRHVLAQTIGKAVIAVPNSVLFSSGVEHIFRRSLLEKNQVEAVISLPPALLHQTQIPFSIIVLNAETRSSDLVSFINGNDERFFAKDGRGRSHLVNWMDLLDTFQQGKDESSVVRILVQEVLDKNSYLEVNAYTLPTERKKIDRVLSDSQAAKLSELVTFVRPPLKQKVSGDSNPDRGIEALEITIGDFTEYGYAQNPTRVVTLEKGSKTDPNYFLESGDILIAVKANTGKVSIVPETANLQRNIPWVVNQSCLILRCTDKIHPKVLFMYLSSGMGQYLLRSISSGATIPLIQLARLKELKIVIPTGKESERIVRDFDRLVELQSQKEELTQEQRKIGISNWSL
jgi:type I restriction enzyme M protein